MPRLWNFIVLASLFGLSAAQRDMSIFKESKGLAWRFFEYVHEHKSSYVSVECYSQLDRVMDLVLQNEEAGYKVLDAWGNLPSGLLVGHYLEMGNFDECLAIEAAQIRPKYCLSSWPLLQDTTIKIGLCLPSECAAADINVLLKEFVQSVYSVPVDGSYAMAEESKCQTKGGNDLGALDWVAIGVLVCLVACLLASSVYDYCIHKANKTAHPLLGAFSLLTNVPQLFKITPKSSSASVIPCLHGIRCISLIWVIFIHCYMMALLKPNINGLAILEWYETPFSMFYQSGTIAVDSFFFLSGLLVIVVAFRQMQRNSGQLQVFTMYAHRYIRLTPVLALAVLIFMSIYPRMGSGPVWPSFVASTELCKETWWQTLIYVQNYAAAGKMCLGHSWYLAVDMQFFVLSPLILYVIWRWQKKGLIAVAVVGLLLAGGLFALIVVDDLSVFATTRNGGADNDEMRKIYYATHARTAPWIIGILFGYYLYTNMGRRVRIPKKFVVLGWTLAMAVFLTVIFALYPKTLEGSRPLTSVEGAFYLTLSRIGWPLALCWLVFACVNGYAGLVNWLLSWSMWQPISKLSYCMYVWHLLIVTANAGRTKVNTHFGDYDVILSFWSNFGLTLLVATFMYLLVEAPMAGIEKVILPNRQTKAPQAQLAANQAGPSVSRECLVDASKPANTIS